MTQDDAHERAWRHCRGRCRRHVHRPVPAGFRKRHVPHARRCRRGAATRRWAFSTDSTALGGAAGMQSIVHGTTVGTNTLLERRGPKIGVIATRGFRDTLEMRRRDRRRTWGLWGDFVPIADRDMRLEVNERTLADGTIRTAADPRGNPRGGEGAAGQRRAGGGDHLHQRLRQRRERAPRARGRARGVAERVRHRLARGAVGNPRVRALVDRGAERLSAAGRRVLSRQARCGARGAKLPGQAAHRAVERRHHVDRHGAEAAGAHRAVGPGRRRGRGAPPSPRPRATTTSSPAISAAPRSTSR